VLWSKKEGRSWVEFEPRLKTQLKRYDLWKINYSKASWDVAPVQQTNGK
jgi:hexosaminidase